MGNRTRCSRVGVLLLLYLGCFCLLQARVSYSQEQGCAPADLKALEGFMKGLASRAVPGWQFNASSSSPIDCCKWVGLTCDSSRRVVGLDLSSMKLRGSISSSLADLDQLSTLDLANNSLSGSVPPQLLWMPRLRLLDMSMNNFSGAIPVNSSLPSLQVFNISSNRFSGGRLPVLLNALNLVEFDIKFNMFSGAVDPSICTISPGILKLYLSGNKLSGELPAGFGNCSSLQELRLDMNDISGSLPDDLFRLSSLKVLHLQDNRLNGTLGAGIGNLSNLVELDLSSNRFSGAIPNSFGRLSMLRSLCVSSNNFVGTLPSSLSNLSSIQVLNLRNNSLHGEIDVYFPSMVQLSSIDLGSNRFTGVIPHDLSSCVKLKTINFAKNNLSGEIPESFKNLAALSFLSLSNNSLSNISSALGTLQHCPSLTALVLTINFRGERIPFNGIQGFKSLQLLVIANCALSGTIPTWLAQCDDLQLVDLSWNRLVGNIPLWVGNLNSLFYLDLSNNSLSGHIPLSLANLTSLTVRNASQRGSLATDFPFFSRQNNQPRGLQYNQLNSFPPTLDLSHNNLTGPIWPQFGNLKKLHVFDLSRNNLTGEIPEELSGMRSLEILNLSYNGLTGRIPSSLNRLTFLSRFSVASNYLVGLIPTGTQFSTFPDSSYEGNMGLCGGPLPSCSPSSNFDRTAHKQGKNKGVIIGMTLGIGLGTALLLTIFYLVVSRTRSKRVEDTEKEMMDSDDHPELSGSSLVLLFQNKENKELSIEDILNSTNSFDQTNIIGCGGFGLVYKANLPDGRKVAIKRLSGEYGQMEREFQAEVETLSRAQHKNLVLLQGYCKVGNDRLLIYSYMENGSLDYWLHEKIDGGSTLDWDMRLRIAQGAAKGLAYLHQSCEPHILHRDIKSSNILLDENFEAHLADFGLARLMLPYDTHVTTDLVGTLGYIPPEYGQAPVATFKGDVYSFGVVLLELLTGRRPIDMCKPKETRDMISWVLQMKAENREAEVFDQFIYDKQNDRQLKQMLEIACLCLSESPKARPLTQQIVSWLDDVGMNDQLVT